MEKQNCGVSSGWGVCETISSFALEAEDRGNFDQIRFATVEDVCKVFLCVRVLAVMRFWKFSHCKVALPVRI